VKHINALKGTVEAQSQTLQTIGGLNKIILEVFQALDPKRWSEEVRVHKQLADEKAQAFVERAREELAKERAATHENAKAVVAWVDHLVEDQVKIAVTLIPYIPKSLRANVLEGIKVHDEWTKRQLIDYAAKAPELSSPQLNALRSISEMLSASGEGQK